MPRLSETERAVNWLRQFRVEDQSDAVKLLDAMVLVSRDDFVDGVRKAILRRSKEPGRIGLYAEREVPQNSGAPAALFEETQSRPRRAFGRGPLVIDPLPPVNPLIGSEALVAQLISELCKEFPQQFWSHPGPDQIRKEKISRLLLVTDFVGSGGHVTDYLESAWRVASVKSWRSLGLIRFEVVAYAATKAGIGVVERHRSGPAVSYVLACPTISTSFGHKDASRLRDLCARYNPASKKQAEPLGYGRVGALLAFAHGCPNNAPRILHRTAGRGLPPWRPLFPERVTSGDTSAFGDAGDGSTIAQRLELLGGPELSAGLWRQHRHADAARVILLLAAMLRGPKSDDAISRRTGLTMPEVAMLIERVTTWGWLDEGRRLTRAGRNEIRSFGSREEAKAKLAPEPTEPYYPKALRTPCKV